MNIGFSQNRQLINSRKRRLDMVNFAEENGISAAVKEFGITYKTVNLWIDRYRREEMAGLADQPHRNGRDPVIRTNRPKSRLTIMKPRNRVSFLSASPIIPKDNEIKPDPIDLTEEIMPEPPTILEPGKEIIIEKTSPKNVSPRHLRTDTKTIQIGLLNLKKIDSFGDLCQKYNLPSWQFTAFEPQTGGAWIAYSFEIGWEQQNEFIKILSKHFLSHGILPNQISFELGYNSAILEKLGQVDMAKTEESPDRDFKLNRFHRLLEDNFYLSLRVRTVSKLMEKAESFLLRYNYKENFESPLNLPPNQLVCRQYSNNHDPEILKFKPIVLEKNQAGKVRYLIGLRMIAGLLTSIVGSVLSRRKRVIKGTSMPLPPKAGLETTSQTRQGIESTDNEFEYINLKNMNWEKHRDKQAKTDTKTSKVRNRQELINRAKELLAQKRSIAELKSTLPMTEGELSMLSQNIMFGDKERNK